MGKVNPLENAGAMAFFAFTLLYAVCLALIFGGTWSFDVAAVQPDAGSAFAIDQVSCSWRDLLSGASTFIPFDVTGLIGSPYFWQELRYAVAAWLAALGVVYYLRGRGLPWLAAYAGGGAYGLAGYAFTLFSAGHMGWFHWLMYGPFAFGLVDRALRGGAWRHWIMLGAVLAWGASRQPDMWLLFTVLTFAYGLWALAREFVPVAGRAPGRIRRVMLGVLATAMTAALVGAPAFLGALTESLAERDRQISATLQATNGGKDGKAAEDASKSADERWRFCTSWSLPPDETVEFFWPRVNGDTSDVNIIELRRRAGWRETTRYTGRIGMPMTEMKKGKAAAKWMPYRQHSLYMGLITVILALLAIVSVFVPSTGRIASKSQTDRAAFRYNRGEIVFWAVAALISLFAAMGCFTPFYNLVFSMPFGGYLRAPVKFVHLVEFAVAVLAGFGAAAALERFSAVKAAFWIVLGLAMVNVVDLARVDALYLGPQDIAFQRGENAAAEDVLNAGGGKVAVLVPPQEGGQMFGESFSCHRAEVADLNAARGDLAKTGARFLFVTGSQLAKMPELNERMRNGSLKVAGTYAVSPRRGIERAADRSRAQAALLEIPAVKPTPAEKPVTPFVKRMLNYLSLMSTLLVAIMVVGNVRKGAST